MRFVTFTTAGEPAPHVGALTVEDDVVDLAAAWDEVRGPGEAPLPATLLGILEARSVALAACERAMRHAVAAIPEPNREWRLRRDAGEYRLLSPLTRPRSIRDFLAVEEHVRNARKQPPPPEWYRLPVYYKGNVDAVFGPDDEIPWPVYTEKLDYELEVCAVIGRTARHVKAADADDYIAGYTIFNDWSARDIQRREMSVGLGPAYGKDFANSLGPAVATDEFDPQTSILRARVDGELWSEGSLAGMRFSFPEIIEWLTLAQTLYPGDLLGSGTVARGSGVEIDRWIRPGAVVELEVDGIGKLRNRVGERRGDLITEVVPRHGGGREQNPRTHHG